MMYDHFYMYTVGPVHIENFSDGETGVARAKAEVFEGLGPGGVAVINADNPWFELLKQAALHVGARLLAGHARGDALGAREALQHQHLVEVPAAHFHHAVETRVLGAAWRGGLARSDGERAAQGIAHK